MFSHVSNLIRRLVRADGKESSVLFKALHAMRENPDAQESIIEVYLAAINRHIAMPADVSSV